MIHGYSEGNARKIGNLMTDAPTIGAQQDQHSIAPNEVVEDAISELYITEKENYSTQIGGSALLALKNNYKNISIGFVGLCDQLNNFDIHYGKSLSPKSELSFIDNQEWLFYTNDNT